MFQSQVITLAAPRTLIGIRAQTNNADEFAGRGKIPQIWGKFFEERLGERMQRRRSPGIVHSVYTNYVDREFGEYTYFLGEEITHTVAIEAPFDILSIPAQKVVRFITSPGPLPQTVQQAWQAIWAMDANALGGFRAYQADYEIYDQRAQDPAHAVVEIHVGIR